MNKAWRKSNVPMASLHKLCAPLEPEPDRREIKKKNSAGKQDGRALLYQGTKQTMEDPYGAEFHRPHEARLHNSVFDTVSRPLSRQSRGGSRADTQSRSHSFADTKIPWDHYGKHLRIYFRREDLERADLFELLLRQVREQVHNFQGVIAYNNQSGQQIIVYNSNDIRHAMRDQGNRLKFYSTVEPDKGYIAAADIRPGSHYRSQSVPPTQNRYSPDNRAPSSMDSNYRYRNPSHQAATPYHGGDRMPMPPPPSTPGQWSYSQNYGQPLLFGMPPHNMLLAHFLTGGHYPFNKFSWVGPNKYHNFGPYPYRHFYNKGGWGPSW